MGSPSSRLVRHLPVEDGDRVKVVAMPRALGERHAPAHVGFEHEAAVDLPPGLVGRRQGRVLPVPGQRLEGRGLSVPGQRLEGERSLRGRGLERGWKRRLPEPGRRQGRPRRGRERGRPWGRRRWGGGRRLAGGGQGSGQRGERERERGKAARARRGDSKHGRVRPFRGARAARASRGQATMDPPAVSSLAWGSDPSTRNGARATVMPMIEPRAASAG
jgi:hypothetical protein